MNTIIIYGEKNDCIIKNNLASFLKQNYSINFFDNNHIYHKGVNPSDQGDSILIIYTNQLNNIDISNAIVIIGNNAKINHIKHINSNVRMIVNSDNTKQINKISKFTSKIYTCGFSSKDYITFSSRNEDSTTISLQRAVHLSEYTCCPFEIPCSISENQSDFHILSAVMTLILIKCLNEKKACDLTKIYF